MITKEFRFHIYAKDKCLFHSLQKEDFDNTWDTLKNLVGLMKTEYSVSDLSYEQVEFVKDISSESSH
jgi:hypothetical protein